MKSLATRFRSMPRALRWALVFGVFVGLYFGVVEPVMDMTSKLNARADRASASLQRYAEQAAERKAQDDRLALGVQRYGDVKLPELDTGRGNELFSKISEVLSTRGIEAPNITQSRAVTLGKDVLTSLLEPSQEVQRVMLEVKIDGAPEEIASVIADLERMPEVTSLGQVVLRRMGKEDERKLQASITPEAWFISERGGRR